MDFSLKQANQYFVLSFNPINKQNMHKNLQSETAAQFQLYYLALNPHSLIRLINKEKI